MPSNTNGLRKTKGWSSSLIRSPAKCAPEGKDGATRSRGCSPAISSSILLPTPLERLCPVAVSQSSWSKLWWIETNKNQSMLRASSTFVVIAMLMGFTGTPAQTSAPTETVLGDATNESSTEPPLIEPNLENTIPPSEPAAIQEYPVPAGTHPHDVAPAPDGTVWYTAQHVGALGRLDPATGETHHILLGSGSAPHGVIVGPDGAPWITDSGLNAIVRVDPQTEDVQVFSLPPGSGNANLNTAAFDRNGVLWVTGQSGIYGRLEPATGNMEVYSAPRGRGPHGITTTPDGSIYYASLANSYVGRIDPH